MVCSRKVAKGKLITSTKSACKDNYKRPFLIAFSYKNYSYLSTQTIPLVKNEEMVSCKGFYADGAGKKVK